MADVAELDIQASPAQQITGDSLQHHGKEDLLFRLVLVFSFTIGSALCEDIGRNESTSASQDGQHVSMNMALVVLCNNHIGFHAGCMFKHDKQFDAMKEILA